MRAQRAACEKATDFLGLEATAPETVKHAGPHNLLAPGHQGSHLLVHLRSVIQNSKGGGKLWTPGLRVEEREDKENPPGSQPPVSFLYLDSTKMTPTDFFSTLKSPRPMLVG